MNRFHSISDPSILLNHSERQNDYGDPLTTNDENVIHRRRRFSSLDSNMMISSESSPSSSSIGFILEQKGLQKKRDYGCSVIVNTKKGGSCIYSLPKPLVSSSCRSMTPILNDEGLAKNDAKVTMLSKTEGKTDDQVVVRFAIDPSTKDVLRCEINEELQYNGNIKNGSYLFENKESLDVLSFPNLLCDNSVDLDFLDEEKIENLFSNTRRCYVKNETRTPTGTPIRPQKDVDNDPMTSDDVQSNNRRKRRLEQFYNRKEYRLSFRKSKRAGEEFMSKHPQLVHEFYRYYVSSLSPSTIPDDTNNKNQKEEEDPFLKRWCESNGRGLEYAILLSARRDHPLNYILDKKMNDAQRRDQTPCLSIGMAHQVALMDARMVD